MTHAMASAWHAPADTISLQRHPCLVTKAVAPCLDPCPSLLTTSDAHAHIVLLTLTVQKYRMKQQKREGGASGEQGAVSGHASGPAAPAPQQQQQQQAGST